MKKKIKNFLLLHVLLCIYSVAGICSKTAAGFPFLSYEFIICYGILLMIMVGYAVMWQQILKRMKLVTAYANKAVTILWGFLWGVLFFEEEISVTKILGMALIIIGVCLVVASEEDKECIL